VFAVPAAVLPAFRRGVRDWRARPLRPEGRNRPWWAGERASSSSLRSAEPQSCRCAAHAPGSQAAGRAPRAEQAPLPPRPGTHSSQLPQEAPRLGRTPGPAGAGTWHGGRASGGSRGPRAASRGPRAPLPEGPTPGAVGEGDARLQSRAPRQRCVCPLHLGDPPSGF
jgi:hypothetical protein